MTFEKETGEATKGHGSENCGSHHQVSPVPVAELDQKKLTCTGPPMVVSAGEAGEEESRGSREHEAAGKIDSTSQQSSPRTVLDIPISGSTDSDSSSGSSSGCGGESIGPDGTVLESHSHQWRALIGGLLQRKKSIRRLSTFPPAPEVTRVNLQWKLGRARSATKGDMVKGGVGMPPPSPVRWKPTWRSFEYRELAAATDYFSSENLIGEGGHAQVFKGCLPDGQLVAVKRLTRKETEEERVGDFLSELGIIAHVNHPNAAHLLGFGVEGGLHLVLQFSPHGSLASVLHGSEEWIDWGIRFRIALGVAQGLRYLHRGCHRRIIHRDIKASNILLTDDYQPQISDFGLAKWLPEQWTHHVVFPIEGTFGYLAPEYFMHGVVNEKTDVFAFGVLLLELITGRRAVDSCRQSLVIWANPLLDANDVEGLIDPMLGDAYDLKEMNNAIVVASMCIHHMSTMRPHMDQVLQLLKREDASLGVNGELKSVVSKPLLFDACDLEDYTCSRYLNDLNRHKQLALEQ
uniref:non-specific serine/threonine protein kinase n=1 Tax=Anthurium amnicola TaxID=1678845 RepID=A0A1D1XIB9_9ARAE